MSGVKVATAHSHSFPSGALSFISCASGRESLPLDENESSAQATEYKTETKKKKFHPLRNLRRMFRRKGRRSSISADSYQVVVPDNPEIPPSNLEQRSCSTSRLQEENLTQNFISNNRLNPGLSLSHDSIFTPDRADSGLSSSDLGNSSLSITVLTPPSRECAMKSQSSCSETSLLSLGSSEVDELSPARNRKISDLDVGVTTYKLSHSAAKHKMAVRPRRNHGAPRSRRKTMTSISPLPTTLEVNEDRLTGRSSSPADVDLEMSSGKITWSQTVVESGEKREKQLDVGVKMEEDQEEETTGQRTESFFGRFLSRRSEKKKKYAPESIGEDASADEKSKKLGKSGKSPNRRQRVEPMEIPASPSARKNQKEVASSSGTVVSSSVSPPKSYCWPTSVATSRSKSPQKTVWSDDQQDDRANVWDRGKTPEVSPVETHLRDIRNPNFVRELTNSVSLFAKDESGKRKKDGDEEEMALKIRRQHSETETPRKPPVAHVDKTEPARFEGSPDVVAEDSCRIQIVAQSRTPKEEPRIYRTLLSFDGDAFDGYENTEVVESEKEKSRTSNATTGEDDEEAREEVKKMNESSPEVVNLDVVKIEIVASPNVEKEDPTNEVEMVVADVKKTATPEPVRKPENPEVVPRTKPVISQKPKDLKRLGNGFVRTGACRSTDASTEAKPDKVEPNLVERRKSELLLLTEAVRPGEEKPSTEESPGVTKDEAATDDPPEEVVLRRKSHTGHAEEQPELMKVFARRSLKVRETEKMAEEVQRSRDSDKENEMADSPKERKKSFDADERREGTDGGKDRKGSGDFKVNVTPLKPEVASRKNLVSRYGGKLSENNSKKDDGDGKPAVLEENSLNKMRKITDVSGSNVTKEDKMEKEVEEEGETGSGNGSGGFKRIQQRKAEWERRAQQSAK